MQGLCGGYCACLGRLHRGMRRAYPPPPDIKLPHSPTRYWRTISGLSVTGRNSRWCDSVGLLCSMVQVPGPPSSLCWLAWSYFCVFVRGQGGQKVSGNLRTAGQCCVQHRAVQKSRHSDLVELLTRLYVQVMFLNPLL